MLRDWNWASPPQVEAELAGKLETKRESKIFLISLIGIVQNFALDEHQVKFLKLCGEGQHQIPFIF